MLRGALGDEAFFDGVRRYYGRYAGGIATTDDFRAVMEEASGQDLSVFFDQWIFQPGYPVFESDVSYDQGAREATVTIRQVQQESWPIFRLPIDLEVVAQDGIIPRRVYLEDRETTIRVPVQDSPIDVRIDPDGWVLKG